MTVIFLFLPNKKMPNEFDQNKMLKFVVDIRNIGFIEKTLARAKYTVLWLSLVIIKLILINILKRDAP